MGLDEGRWQSMERIAGHVAATHPSEGLLTPADRYDTCLDAIVEHVYRHGWPAGPLKPLFLAASAGLSRAQRESTRHLARGDYWVTPPGSADAIGEAVTDKIAARQILGIFTPPQRAAVQALAAVMAGDGDWRAAAARLGISDAAMASRLSDARHRAVHAWVAPGDHGRVYRPRAGGRGKRRIDTYHGNQHRRTAA